MELQNQVTNKEISQRIKELGVKQESHFFWARTGYDSDFTFLGSKSDMQVFKSKEFHDEAGANDTYDLHSAFTVAELGEILPTDITIKKRTYWLNTARMSHGWSVGYVSRKGDYYLMNEHESIEVTEADARGKMLIYLLENNLITLQ